METLREYSNKPVVVGVAALILGVILGVIYGWVIDPVEWTDAAARDLRQDLREDWLRMAIDSYEKHQDPLEAQARWLELDPYADETLADIKLSPEPQNPQSIAAFEAVVVLGAPVVPGEEEVAPANGGLGTILPIMCLVVVLLGAALGGVFYLRQRSLTMAPAYEQPMMEEEAEEYVAAPGVPIPDVPVQPASRPKPVVTGEEPPLGQFMTTYMLGDDMFDDSFSIDSPSGEFLGECGVGISEQIGVGDPKRVTAFEVWLFDKNDIQTVTKVLMSEHAYMDEELRQRLSAKGEPVLAEPGTQVTLTTATLQLVARVVDMAYGDADALPEQSSFDRITLELAVWPVEA
jgi:hypothetical protein